MGSGSFRRLGRFEGQDPPQQVRSSLGREVGRGIVNRFLEYVRGDTVRCAFDNFLDRKGKDVLKGSPGRMLCVVVRIGNDVDGRDAFENDVIGRKSGVAPVVVILVRTGALRGVMRCAKSGNACSG